jgi:hypothetical protein
MVNVELTMKAGKENGHDVLWSYLGICWEKIWEYKFLIAGLRCYEGLA